MKKKKGIIFDIDGLIVDSETVTMDLMVKRFGEYGVEITREFYTSFVGHSRKDIDEMLVELCGEGVPSVEIMDGIHSYMDTIPLPVKPGFFNIMDSAKEAGYILGVGTSSNYNHAKHSLGNIGVLERFDVVVCADMVSKSKPEPDLYLKALEKMGLEPDEAWILEDAQAGVESGCNAGIDVICIPDMLMPKKEVLDRAFAVVKDLDEAWKVIKENS